MDADEPTKICATCKLEKSVTQFYRVAKGMPGRRPYCKACHLLKRRVGYTKDQPYAQVLARDYGLTLDEYNARLRRQTHRCAVCRRPETIVMKRTGELRRLSVDHDHVTGTVRGLLCHRCNLLVWAFEDNHTTLDAIRAYVDDFRRSFAEG